jgi:2-phospho-L-lactate guanylyltransferase
LPLLQAMIKATPTRSQLLRRFRRTGILLESNSNGGLVDGINAGINTHSMSIKTVTPGSDPARHGDDLLWALVPVKTLERAKQRLEPCLGPDRRDLALCMFNDVMKALRDSQQVSRVVVVTADARVAELAMAWGAVVVDEPRAKGLNAAIELGIGAIQQKGGHQVVILPTDIPLMTGSELDRLLSELDAERMAGGNSVMGLCASNDGLGTNLLSCDTRLAYQPRYGHNSYLLHKKDALSSQRRPVSLSSPALALDIDQQSDLHEFNAVCLAHPQHQESETWAYLQGTGLISGSGKPKARHSKQG